jgi:DNA helicase HerA-like ATPase
MGKTTLALRLANSLAAGRRVTILDQTGEYVTKRGLEVYTSAHDDLPTGVSVLEPALGTIAADEAYNFLQRLVRKAAEEYRTGPPRSRVLIIDEAHQFIPEPAGLGFGAPGRDNAYKFGVLMMQVRKFGITIILISQRTAVVGKSALSQCENLIAFKSVDQTGLDYLEAILGENARFLLPSLIQGQALVFGPATSTEAPVAVQVVAL